jgi:hypothetical protein
MTPYAIKAICSTQIALIFITRFFMPLSVALQLLVSSPG